MLMAIQTLCKLPRNLFELLTVLAFVAFLSQYILSGSDVKESIAVLGLFAFAFKILPSANKILNCFQRLDIYTFFYLIKNS